MKQRDKDVINTPAYLALRGVLKKMKGRKRDAPRHQHTGQIKLGPRRYVVCPLCTVQRNRVTGTAKATQKQHRRWHDDQDRTDAED